jgi:hypothetical protein
VGERGNVADCGGAGQSHHSRISSISSKDQSGKIFSSRIGSFVANFNQSLRFLRTEIFRFALVFRKEPLKIKQSDKPIIISINLNLNAKTTIFIFR